MEDLLKVRDCLQFLLDTNILYDVLKKRGWSYASFDLDLLLDVIKDEIEDVC